MYVASDLSLCACHNNVLSTCPAYRGLTQFGTTSAATTTTRLGGYESLHPRLEHNRCTVSDADLNVSVDLGEAVTRTPALTPRPKFRSASPVLPDYLSPLHNATFAPAIGEQRPGGPKALGSLQCVAECQSNLCAYVQPPLPPVLLSIMPRRLYLGFCQASLLRW